jgi:hypothetical protein
MSRSHLVLLTLFIAIALSQTPVVGQQASAVVVTGAATVVAPLGAEDIVARMMSFDRNRDGRIEISELPDRMHKLLDRGDTGQDGTLDGAEIRRLATTPTVALTTGGFKKTGDGYTFGDQVGFSTRMHIDGALNDLMLQSPAKEKAQTIVKGFEDDLEVTATADLLNAMEPLLSADQLKAFRTLVDRQINRGVVAPFQLKDGTGNRVAFAFFGMDLGRRIEAFSLPTDHRREAMAALERFNAKLRLGDEDRLALLKQLKGVLTDEERDNFRAALERRPLVKAGFPGIVSGVAGFEMLEKVRGVGVQRNLLLDPATAGAAVIVR